MAFSETYLMKCLDVAPRWTGKETTLGDWYVRLQSGVDVVSTKDLALVQFSDPETIFIPDAEDLLELMDNQIAAWSFDPAQKKLRIEYEPQSGWCVTVEYGGRITRAVGESIHVALLHAVSQMVVFKSGDLEPLTDQENNTPA